MKIYGLEIVLGAAGGRCSRKHKEHKGCPICYPKYVNKSKERKNNKVYRGR